MDNKNRVYRAKVIEIRERGFTVEGIGDNNKPYQMGIDFDNFDCISEGVRIGTEYNITNGEKEIEFIKVHD